MGTPKGEGIEIEDVATAAAARIAVKTILFSFSSLWEILNEYIIIVIMAKIQ